MYASVWKRFWAFMIDLAVFIVLFIFLAQLLNDFTVSLILLVIIWLYYALLESSPWQASLGKRLMGLKVVDKRGRRLTFSKATKRLLVRLVTNVAFYIGFFTAAFDKHKETLHDKVSHSLVISADSEFNPDNYEEPAAHHDLTLLTVISVLAAIIFVLLLLRWVVLPQYQKFGDRVHAAHITDNLNLAVQNRPARLQAAKGGPEVWLKSYSGCINNPKDPQTLDCNGYRMTLQEDGKTEGNTMNINYSNLILPEKLPVAGKASPHINSVPACPCPNTDFSQYAGLRLQEAGFLCLSVLNA